LGLPVVREVQRGDESRVPTVTNPIGLPASPVSHRTAPPRLGEHDREIRDWLLAGY
jgi:crotonobetainyl-CoA:carnitine CoA-transferase CaiB-like acyl-CoA transferase